ncbi:Alpha-(1,3)-fucosyltransferase C [Folsomia candida]|uniref:Fucosyltransferase n=2 Tax=Folsomia candida TaxID=158441 RepID=A0A226EBK4_FOLCA|nr:Alpha-(1,3)-fucosyltransferase C [Folsomia candida]
MPESRQEDQVWVYLNRESPDNSNHDLPSYANLFNWTMTYRTDSDVLHPYAVIVDEDTTQDRMGRRLINPDYSNWINLTRKKTKLAAWAVSNCNTDSKRENLVEKLRQFVDIDVFGRCGNYTCPFGTDTCFNFIEETYKFYFAFENSLCDDYITEKFFYMLNRTIIPVVFGAGDYASISPRHSHIDVRDFSSVRKLAEYLIYLDSNEEEYVKYFWWKKYYRVRQTDGWCKLCYKLKDKEKSVRQIIPDLEGWYRFKKDEQHTTIPRCVHYSGNFSTLQSF